MLAEVLVGAVGGKKANDQPYLATDFLQLQRLRAAATPAPAATPTRRQTAAQMERRLESWIGGSNAAWREDPVAGGRPRTR